MTSSIQILTLQPPPATVITGVAFFTSHKLALLLRRASASPDEVEQLTAAQRGEGDDEAVDAEEQEEDIIALYDMEEDAFAEATGVGMDADVSDLMSAASAPVAMPSLEGGEKHQTEVDDEAKEQEQEEEEEEEQEPKLRWRGLGPGFHATAVYVSGPRGMACALARPAFAVFNLEDDDEDDDEDEEEDGEGDAERDGSEVNDHEGPSVDMEEDDL